MYEKEERIIKMRNVFRDWDGYGIEEFNGYHAMVLATVQLFHAPMVGASAVNLSMLYFMTTANIDERKMKIDDALNDIINWGLVKGRSLKYYDDTFFLNIPKSEADYTLINASMLRTIIASSTSFEIKANMILIYTMLSMHIGEKAYYVLTPQVLSVDTGLDIESVRVAVKELSKHKIIQYSKVHNNRKDSEEFVYVLCDEPDYQTNHTHGQAYTMLTAMK